MVCEKCRAVMVWEHGRVGKCEECGDGGDGGDMGVCECGYV